MNKENFDSGDSYFKGRKRRRRRRRRRKKAFAYVSRHHRRCPGFIINQPYFSVSSPWMLFFCHRSAGPQL